MDDQNFAMADHPAAINGLLDSQQNALPQEESVPAIRESTPPEVALEAQRSDSYSESNEERNFRNLRNKAERLQRERDEAFMRLKSYETQQPEEPDLSIAPNDLAEGKHINKVHSKIQELENQLVETRLRAQYPDIDSVVSAENMAILQRDYPDIANTLGSSKNLYSKAVSAYTLVKKLGISNGVGPYDQDKAMAQRNAAKPKPLASVSPQQGDSALSHANAFANGLTDSLKKQLQKEMADAMRNR